MAVKTNDRFIESVGPLFKERSWLYIVSRILFVLLVGTVISPYPWLFVVVFPLLLTIGVRLDKLEKALADKVWRRFSGQLTPLKDTPQARGHLQPLDGVMGEIGDNRSLSLLAQGAYGPYRIRLLDQNVSYIKPNDNKEGYACGFRILEITTRQDFYHVFVDSKKNNRAWQLMSGMAVLSRSLRDNKTVSVEGDVNEFFTIYVPPDNRFESLVTLSPEKLLALRDYGMNFDVEFINNKIYVISSAGIKNIADILMYQQEVLELVGNLGRDIVRTRQNISNVLSVKKLTDL